MQQNIGICLSGGGARGIAHVGVLQALEEHNIAPRYISGSSAGSIVGVLYASGISPQDILEMIIKTSMFKVFRLGLGAGLVSINHLKEILSEYVPGDDFLNLEKKLYVCVTNLNTGKWEIRHKGILLDTIVASSAIPMIFEPVKIENATYVDGGVLNNMPLEPLKLDCQHIIAVNVIPTNTMHIENWKAYPVATRSMDLVVWANMMSKMHLADIWLDIEGIEQYGVFDFNQAEAIYELGYKYAIQNMERIQMAVE